MCSGEEKACREVGGGLEACKHARVSFSLGEGQNIHFPRILSVPTPSAFGVLYGRTHSLLCSSIIASTCILRRTFSPLPFTSSSYDMSSEGSDADYYYDDDDDMVVDDEGAGSPLPLKRAVSRH